jgi:hypothetical protein
MLARIDACGSDANEDLDLEVAASALGFAICAKLKMEV